MIGTGTTRLGLALGVLLVAPLVPAQGGTSLRGWEPVETISADTVDAYAPHVVVDQLGSTTAVWEQGRKIWVTRRLSGGSWESPVALGRGGAPVLDADDAGNVTVAWWGPHRSILASRLRPGHPWTAPATLSRPVRRGDGNIGALGPEIDVGTGGAAAVVFEWGSEESPSWGWKIRAAYRAPGGRWRTSNVTGLGSVVQDPVVAVGPAGDADLLWTDQGIMAAHKPASGGWTQWVRLRHRGWGADVEVGPDGRAVAAWTQPVRGHGQPMFSSTHRPSGWTDPARISSRNVRAWEPDIGIDQAGEVTVAWWRPDDVVEVTGRTPGGTWGVPLTMSDATDGRMYGGLSLSVDPAGDALLVWTRMVKVGGVWEVFMDGTYRSLGSWMFVQRVTPSGEGEPSEFDTGIAPDGTGVAVWDSWLSGDSSRIRARTLTP